MYKVYSIYDIFKNYYDAGIPDAPEGWEAQFRIAVPYTYYDGKKEPVQKTFQILSEDVIDELLMNYERFAFKVGYNRAPFEHFLQTWIRYRDIFLDYNLPQMLSAYLSKYNPLENYDGFETEDTNGHTRNHQSGKVKTKTNLDQEVNQSETVTHKETTYDSATLVTKYEDTRDPSIVNTTGDADSNYVDYGTMSQKAEAKTVYDDIQLDNNHLQNATDAIGNKTVHKHGNMGVRTTSEMIELELKMRRFDILKYIVKNFIDKYFFPY